MLKDQADFKKELDALAAKDADFKYMSSEVRIPEDPDARDITEARLPAFISNMIFTLMEESTGKGGKFHSIHTTRDGKFLRIAAVYRQKVMIEAAKS